MEILVLHGDTNVANAISSGCAKAGYSVTCAAQGEVGLKNALERRFDLIVLDWGLPEKDGVTILRELREHKIFTPVMVLLEEDNLMAVISSLGNGANDCVAKPFDMDVIIARMRALIRRSKWDRADVPSCSV